MEEKKKVGRKPKADEDKRTVRITFLVKPSTYEDIVRDRDEKDYKDMSSYIEAAIKEFMKK